MWAIRKPCEKERDDILFRSHLHSKVFRVISKNGITNSIDIDDDLFPTYVYFLSKFLLFNTKKEAEAVFSKIQEVRKCTQ